MKTFLGILISFFISAFLVIKEKQSSSTYLVTLFLIIFGLGAYLYYRRQNRDNIYSIIASKIKALSKQIRENERIIEILRNKIVNMEEKVFTIVKIDDLVKNTVNRNIEIWKEQLFVHQKIIDICQKRIDKLQQHKEEIILLNHLTKEVENEPNAKDKLDELVRLNSEISFKINKMIEKEIERLILQVKTDLRAENIGKIKTQLINLEVKAAS